ncbi:MAG: hypothetical protein NC311_10105 [Muribaculaceae bacterium]|nr:hypothetical protein [Muribaculaceae bacterium]
MSYTKPNIDYAKIDPHARGMVRYFNEHAQLPTAQSCEGHAGSLFWIQFRDDVTEADIRRFMEAHTADWSGFIASGWFCRRFEAEKAFGAASGTSCLCYVAPDYELAAKDLGYWCLDGMAGGVERRPGQVMPLRDGAEILVKGTVEAQGCPIMDHIETELPGGKAAWLVIDDAESELDQSTGEFWQRAKDPVLRDPVAGLETSVIPTGLKIGAHAAGDMPAALAPSKILVTSGRETWQPRKLPEKIMIERM